MHFIARYFFCFGILFPGAWTHAGSLSGIVAGILDGDTITLLDGSGIHHRIRLAAIDAPEKAQAFGRQGKEMLAGICHGKRASIQVVDTDRYGRTVGEVTCAGVNANEAMIEAGMAWVYEKHAKGYGHLFPIEEEARAGRRGLWADTDPLPPWEWRRQQEIRDGCPVWLP